MIVTLENPVTMDKQYSVKFFASFLNSLQEHCKSFIDFNQLVEVSGYVCVEIDNTKKERYVLSELVQSSGNVISESYCTKAFNTPVRIFNKSSKQNSDQGKTNGNSKVDSSCKKNLKSNSKLLIAERSQDSSNAETELALRISSVSSLAEADKEVLSSDSQNSLTEDEVLELTAEDAVVKVKDAKSSNNPNSQHQQLYKDGWEGRDTFVFSFPSEKSNFSLVSKDIHKESSQEPFQPLSQQTLHSLWHQPSESRNQDLDQILSQGQNWPQPESESASYVASVDFEMKSESEEAVHPAVIAVTEHTEGDGDDDLAVLSDEYFTAQMLAHTSKALDPSVSQEGKSPASCLPSTSSTPNKPIRTGRRESTSEQISIRSPHVAAATPQAAGSMSPTNKPCVLVIDEDSDDIVEVDMEQQSSDDELSELSQDMVTERQSKPSPKRKMPLNEEEKQRKRYKSSLKYQRYAVKLFNDFQKNKGEGVRPIQTMHPEKLNEVLAEFYTSLRKSNGEEFGCMSLRNVQSHLERYLKDANYPFSITKDEQFKHSKQILMNKIAIARARARAKPPTGKPTLINDEDISVLFEVGELGGDSPDSLLNTMWFMNSMFLQIKQNADHYDLRWGDIGLCENEYGQEMLECYVGKSKGRKLYYDEHDAEQCYVTLYKKYRDKRPPSSLTEDSPFYLSPNRVFVGSGCWFSIERASVSRLTGVFKKMATAAGLENKRLP